MNTNVFRNLYYGLYVITSTDQGRNVGCIANSIMQITSSPATVALSLNHDNYTNPCIAGSKKFAVSILSEESDPGIITTFGFQSSKTVDKFEKTDYCTRNDLPIIQNTNGYLICEVIDTMETDTHTVFLAKVVDGDVLSDLPSMSYAYYHKVVKGKSPKNAPTYLPEDDTGTVAPTASGKWTCSVCGYVYDGDIPFEELPDDFVCPVCKMPKSKFEKR